MSRRRNQHVLPAIEHQHVHNPGPPWPTIMILSAAIAALIIVGLYQWILVVLADFGAENPRAAFGLGLGCMVLVPAAGVFASWLWNVHADRSHARKLELMREHREMLAIQHKLQQATVVDSRALSKHSRRVHALICALVVDALSGKQNFSFRKAGDYVLAGEPTRLGKDSLVVKEALEWLRSNGMVQGNSWTGEVTSLAEVQRMLYQPPIQQNPLLSASSSRLDDGSYAHIEEMR